MPLCAGRIHIMRKVDPQGVVTFLNEPWMVGKRWMGEYVRATIDTARQQVSFWHKPDARCRTFFDCSNSQSGWVCAACASLACFFKLLV